MAINSIANNQQHKPRTDAATPQHVKAFQKLMQKHLDDCQQNGADPREMNLNGTLVRTLCTDLSQYDSLFNLLKKLNIIAAYEFGRCEWCMIRLHSNVLLPPQ